MFEFFKIIGLVAGGFLLYVFLYLQITAGLCIKCFDFNLIIHTIELLLDITYLIGYDSPLIPPIYLLIDVDFDSPLLFTTFFAFIWGIASVCILGLPFGFIIAILSRVGSCLPKLNSKDIFKYLIISLCIVGIGSFIFSIIGFINYEYERTFLLENKYKYFFPIQCANIGGIIIGFIVAVGVMIWCIIKRVKLNKK